MLTLVFAQEISMDRLETVGPVQLQNTPIAHISFEHPIKLMEDVTSVLNQSPRTHTVYWYLRT
jgi:hypothetical protein